LGLVCDVTRDTDIINAIELGIATYGGLDFVVSNAGTFPSSCTIADMSNELWDNSINTNLTSHQKLLTATIPYLELGINPAVLIVGSKNVPAPGPGASAYSVAKAGLTQLSRVAALELASKKIRVNTIHPNAVFDTALWTDEILEKRASHYGLSVQEYKSNNLLKLEVTSADVADLICTMVGPTFSKTTGAQVTIDGGNERVI
jgi:NAD(P)-dependent dehydrogenase (short-subunit alcohol dehydrogenase family)